jgi:ubiquinone/menaquinone biosynthesis C-methylase UbiE
MSKKHQEVVQKQFTKTAEAFSKYAVRDTPEMLAEKVEFAAPQADDLVLDVACGPGAFVLAMAPRVRFARGIDLTESMLRQARAFQAERGVANAAFDRGEAERLPYAEASFDLVSCQFAFHHLPKPERALAEMIRVTRPAGRLLVVDTLGPESDSKFDLHNQIERLRDPSHALSLRLTTFLEIFEKHHLEVTRQAVRRRERSFQQWMLRAGLKPEDEKFRQIQCLLENSADGDRAGFAPKPQNGDLVITHHEGMFMLRRAASADPRR